MQRGERFLLDWFEAEALDPDYRLWSADTTEPVADIETLPEACRVCMLRSGLKFTCDSLDDAERRIGACRLLGL
ncbi:hypothetical protein [Curtobacterium sp. VKM Ac-1395]|uniref:hypothetical protein n=1 Tax=Curtobacterium sp. VKM Ac-1395 TaxID=2783815 RepID=UPI00188BC831|nr:hypothetical protein [Curtobacterium sp. VKM Ac-1395]MBF4588708.1 hypothetical protein [Curtobacterium sp. VKM Ac-1395]